MSELFDFRVVAVDGATARIHVLTVHPDQLEVPDAKNFALQIVVDAYWNLREGFVRGQLLGAHPRRGELEDLVADVFGKETPITATEYAALQGNVAVMRAAGVSSIGMRTVGGQPRYQKIEPPRYDAVRRDAESRVVSVRLEQQRNNPRRNHEAPDAEATIVATFADPALLSHLRPGLRWPSAIYDFVGW